MPPVQCRTPRLRCAAVLCRVRPRSAACRVLPSSAAIRGGAGFHEEVSMAANLKRLERMVKGVSNHRRIEILGLLDTRGEQDLTHISRALGINFKTCYEHTRRLAIAGLVYKQPKGQSVLHTVSPLGKKVLTFLRTLE